MKNIVIYTDKNSSNLAEVVSSIEDSNVRLENASNLKDYETLNPGVIIIESVPDIKDVLMVTKFKQPILFIGETFKGCTVRAVAFDYVKTPVDNQELLVRVKNMLKIRELRDKLKTLSTTDELTGLHNRKYLLERMEQEISRSKRYGTALSVLLFDLDFFKAVNDIYGYEWGDVLLKSIADKLKQLIRKEDIITRYGDEEFIVVLPNTSEDNAFLFAERFRKDIEKWNSFQLEKKNVIQSLFLAEFLHSLVSLIQRKMRIQSFVMLNTHCTMLKNVAKTRLYNSLI